MKEIGQQLDKKFEGSLRYESNALTLDKVAEFANHADPMHNLTVLYLSLNMVDKLEMRSLREM